jgi:hypothetical protein
VDYNSKGEKERIARSKSMNALSAILEDIELARQGRYKSKKDEEEEEEEEFFILTVENDKTCQYLLHKWLAAARGGGGGGERLSEFLYRQVLEQSVGIIKSYTDTGLESEEQAFINSLGERSERLFKSFTPDTVKDMKWIYLKHSLADFLQISMGYIRRKSSSPVERCTENHNWQNGGHIEHL